MNAREYDQRERKLTSMIFFDAIRTMLEQLIMFLNFIFENFCHFAPRRFYIGANEIYECV